MSRQRWFSKMKVVFQVFYALSLNIDYYIFFLLFQKTRYFPMLTLPHQYTMFAYFPMHGLMKWKSPALQNMWCSCIFQFRTCIEKYVICQVLDFFKFWTFQGGYFKFCIFLSVNYSNSEFFNMKLFNSEFFQPFLFK